MQQQQQQQQSLPSPPQHKQKKRTMAESPKALQAYQIYESLGPDRSLARVEAYYHDHTLTDSSGKRYQPNVGSFKQWSSIHDWVRRAKDHDAQIEAGKQKEALQALTRMNEEHAFVCRAEWIATIGYLKKLREANKLGATAAVEYVKFFMTNERLARGAVSERIEQITSSSGVGGGGPNSHHLLSVDPRSLSPDELKQLKAMVTRAIAEQESSTSVTVQEDVPQIGGPS